MFLCGRYLDHHSAASRSEIIASPWTTPEGNRQDEGQQSGLEACQAHRYRTATCAVDLDSVAMASDLEKLETSLLGDIASPRPVTFLG